MALQHFCNSCGYSIAFTVTRPASCPKCSCVFVKVAPIAAPIPVAPKAPKRTVTARVVEEDDELDDLPPPPPRRARAKSHRVISADDEGDQSAAASALDRLEDGDDAPTDRRAARRLARELAATIDPSSIRVLDDDRDSKVRFGDLVAAGEAARRAQGGQS